MSDVSTLLQRSRQAHAAFHARHTYLGQGKRQQGSEAQGKQSIELARELRAEAHQADPEHTDPAWQEDKVPHAEIVAFYDQYLATH